MRLMISEVNSVYCIKKWTEWCKSVGEKRNIAEAELDRLLGHLHRRVLVQNTEDGKGQNWESLAGTAKLKGKKMNHSACKTMVTSLSNENVPETQDNAAVWSP